MTSSSSHLADLSVEPAAFRMLTAEQKDRLTCILDRYLSELERGVPPDPRQLIGENSDLAEPLQLYLNSLNDLQGVSAGFRNNLAEEDAEEHDERDGQRRLGDFRLGREIGRGGMGVVYEAQQISLDRRVALKVLPFAAVLDSQQISRFKNEAQAAAQLHHPHIVPVFAVGAERGVHYYAMQYIDGQPLDRAIRELRRQEGLDTADVERLDDSTMDWADEDLCWAPTRRSYLTRRSRNRREYVDTVIRLGIDAALALHAAHEYGVIHRDIKPSNLLLDEHGKIWVTDFGLARCQSDVSLTRTGDVVGTMRYMSPEQAQGKSVLVDQRTDIYSLAVTLYELLTLHPAIPGDDGPGVLRSLDQHETRRLCDLCPSASRELETVVMKAMAADRDDRYFTAAEFADDLQRVLDGRPTVAQPQTLSQRLARWSRRHRRLVVAAGLTGLLAFVGFALSTLLIAREKLNTERNFQRAERHLQRANEAVDRFGAKLAERLATVPGAEQVRRELLRETLGYYRESASEAARDPSMQADLALTYSKIGVLADQMGSTDEALEAHQQALVLFQQLVDEAPNDVEYRRRLATCQNNLGLTLRRAGRIDEARRFYGLAVAGQQSLLVTSDSPTVLSDLALSHTNLGLLLSETNALTDAAASFREAIRLQERLLAGDAGNAELRRNLAASYNNLSAVYLVSDLAKAEQCYAVALKLQQTLVEAHPQDARYQSDWGLTLNNLGAVQARRQQFTDAAASYDRAIAIQEKLVTAVPSHKSYRRDLAVSCNNLGLMYSKLHEPQNAKASFQRALEIQKELVTQYPDDLELQSSLGGIFNNLGIVLEEQHQREDAAVAYKNAVDHQRIAFNQAADVARYRSFLSKHYYNYGRVLRELGHPDQAARSALARRELWPNDPQRLFEIAKELAATGRELPPGPDSDIGADRYGELAVETLEQALAAGLELPHDVAERPPFDQLKNQPGFARLLATGAVSQIEPAGPQAIE